MVKRLLLSLASAILVIAMVSMGCGDWYELTVMVSPAGSGTATFTGSSPFPARVEIPVQATANQGWRFDRWTADAGSFADAFSASTTFTMPSRDATITANFSETTVIYYTLTMAVSGSGSTTPAVGQHTYAAGTEVPISAAAAAGWEFINWTGDTGTIDDVDAHSTTIIMNSDYSITANFGEEDVDDGVGGSLAAGAWHTIGLKPDGTVIAVGDDAYGQCNIDDWSDIKLAAAGWGHTVGLRYDGAVVAVGWNDDGQCDVGGWADIVHLAAGYGHTVGLRSDGNVVAVGHSGHGQCDVGGWTGIVQVAAGSFHTVGLRADGTVIAVGDDAYGMCNVGGWKDIVQVAAGDTHTVGLKSDGTVVAVGSNWDGESDVEGWTSIVQVAAGSELTVGLRADGTVVAVGNNALGQCDVSGWSDIVQISAGSQHTVGLKYDGTVLAVGSNLFGQCDVGGWMLG